MKKRMIALLMMSALVFGTGGCGGTGEMPEPASPEQGSDSSADGQTEADPENTGEGETEADRSVLSGTLEVWSSGEELGRFVEGFQAAYPDVTVNITVVPNEDFVAKLTPTLAGGQGGAGCFYRGIGLCQVSGGIRLLG